MSDYFDGLWLVRLAVQRGLAAIYLVAFVSALCQFRPLLGERGLLPVRRLLAQVSFRALPSVIHSVENNLSLANMDFEHFVGSVGSDGIFRGFPRR